MENKKLFYKTMLAIAIPVALQNLITSSINTIDTLMISSLGDVAVAGVGIANQFFFFYFMICFGLVTGAAILIAQYWGRRNWEEVRTITQLTVVIATIIGILFTIIALIFPKQIIGLIIQDPNVIEEGAIYLRVVSLSYIPSAISFVYSMTFRTTGNPKTPLFATIVSVFFNVFFNYVFIFGVWGFPRLGIAGAAIGTIIARFAELSTLYFISRSYNGPLNYSLKELTHPQWHKIKRYSPTILPVMINETFWSLGQIMYSVAYALIGTEATAAVQIVIAVQNLALVIVRGLSSSCSVMVGEKVGQDKFEEAQLYAKRFLLISIITGVLMGALIIISAPYTLMLFKSISQNVYILAHKSLNMIGIMIVFIALSNIIIVGILRGGGDTGFSMKAELFSLWVVGVPLSFFGAAILKLPIHLVVGLACAENICKVLLGIIRIQSGKWVRNLTMD